MIHSKTRKVHELKIDPIVFDMIKNRLKTFEFRRNDRKFHVGEVLRLLETKYNHVAMQNGAPLEYTGNQLDMVITYIVRGPDYGVPDGFAVMSIVEQSEFLEGYGGEVSS